jgi:TolA-binding protein
LLELQNQIDSLKSDQAVMRGSFEQFLKDLSEVQVKQKDVLQTVDSRLSKFEPIKVTLDGLEFQADPAEKKQFDGALTVFRTGDFAAAQNSLSAFLLKYPSSGFAPSALFWLGNAQYATKDYKESIANFRKLLSIAPQHARAPEAMLAISNNWVEGGQKSHGRPGEASSSQRSRSNCQTAPDSFQVNRYERASTGTVAVDGSGRYCFCVPFSGCSVASLTLLHHGCRQ